MASEPKERKVITNGPHTEEALSALRAQPLGEASLMSILDRAAQVIRRSVDPLAGKAGQPTDGLLYGLIQSGKTSIITVASAMAMDNGFTTVIVLTSNIDLLYDQTIQRLRSALRGLKILGKQDWKDAQRFESHLRTSKCLIVCSKDPKKLRSLIEAFKAAGARNLSAMVIDDEADQASLNTFASKNSQQVSRINSIISELRAFFTVNTYLQVTATPQALFLQTPKHAYRPSFTVLSEPGPGYVGGEAFFGEGSNLLRDVQLAEVMALQATNQPSPTGNVPKGLKQALYTFLVAATFKQLKEDKQSSFLCHVSLKTKDHTFIVDLISRFKQQTIRAFANKGSAAHDKLMVELKEVHADLSETQPDMYKLKDMLEKLSFYLQGATVKPIDAVSNEEIELDSVFNIFVGGNKLGRGVTIKNLLISYYGRNPRNPNADTVLQHARMYGYRQSDLGLTRLFLPANLAQNFRLIHQMEASLRDVVERHPEGQFEGLYIAAPLKATRRNVLDPNALGMFAGGASVNPSYPLRNGETKKYTDWLDAKLHDFNTSGPGQEVTIDFVKELINRCIPDPAQGIELWNLKILEVALDKIKKHPDFGNKAYIVVRKNRRADTPRRESRGILTSGDEALAPLDAPTLFMFRQNRTTDGQPEVWWPQLRFPDGNYVLAFSLER